MNREYLNAKDKLPSDVYKQVLSACKLNSTKTCKKILLVKGEHGTKCKLRIPAKQAQKLPHKISFLFSSGR